MNNSLRSKTRYVDEARDRFCGLLKNNISEVDYISTIDSKHKHIVSLASQELISYATLRCWSGQSDQGAPPQFTINSIFNRGPLSPLKWIKECYASIRFFKWQGYYDDLFLLNLFGFSRILEACPVHELIGYSQFSRHTLDGINFSTNERWIRYIYFCGIINKFNLLSNANSLWVDIGSFYGGLQYVVNKFLDKPLRNILVDFEHQLCRSFVVLSYHFPSHKHFIYQQSGEIVDIFSGESCDFHNLPGSYFLYVSPSCFGSFSQALHSEVDLVSNFFSFGEMKRHHFDEYLHSQIFSKARYQFLVNRFESSPSFEPTYEDSITILDYLCKSRSREVLNFGVSPIHHYNLINRKIFEKYSPRPVSSPYFQLITKKTFT